ncbi:SCO family protein [Aestuariimicrobium ganziense]|uniref:SCO family protein n=1 Tax=Aestuariimicrobium ganziense TaxID=2773677 RepID=UPI0019426338|nr:SCO family protein [Aestuariimicrobium ganziense]
MQRRRLLRLAGGLAAATAGLTACSSDDTDGPAAEVGERPGGYLAGTQLADIWALSTDPMTDTDGKPASMVDRAGTVTLLFYGYTNCPDVCTGILADLSSAIQRLDAGQAEKVEVLLVTTDPARDTPQVIKDYLHRIDERFVGLTADLALIKRIAQGMGIAIEDGVKLPSGGYEIEHGTQVIGFGKNHKAQVLWSEGTSVANYKHDIALLLSRQD